MSFKSGASLAALAIALGFSLPAAAQMPPPSQKPAASAPAPSAPVTGQIVTQDNNTILAKDLIGQTVYGPDKAKIGTISDLILSKDGKNVQGFVIGVGGFLGIGEKSVALQMDRLQTQPKAEGGGMQLVMDVKKEELSNAPAFKSRRDQEAEKEAAERARNQPQQPTRPTPRPGN
jgi:sporulation protein YlmC with PRC-barrel domain